MTPILQRVPEQQNQNVKYQSDAPTLDKIVKLDMLLKEDAESIAKIWTQYHADKDGISAFILPMPRETGLEFYFLQFQSHQCYITSLLEYKSKGEKARPFLTITHFPELLEKKGIVLMKGNINDNPKRMLSTGNAQFLAFALQRFYASDDQPYISDSFFSFRFMTTTPRVLTGTQNNMSSYNAVKEKGFDITSGKFGNAIFHPHSVVQSVHDVTSKHFDCILVTLKAIPEAYNVADIIAPVVTDNNTIIALIQNGLDVEKPIFDRFPDNPIISIVAYISVSQNELGKITMQGKESLLVGKYSKSKAESKDILKFIEHLRKGGVSVEVTDDIEKVRWQKLFWNASFSSVCTMTGMTTTEVLANKEASELVKSIMHDVITVANAEGYDFNHKEQIEAFMARTQASTKHYKPSMQLDKERGNPMEIEVILGAPLKRAQARRLSVPRLDMMYSICSAANQHILNKISKI
ncbi:hypothetical protein RO3G_17193 [Rhizopus delemar RA 99-880]|uniref:2-dehydropantoate 2-reductase n=1 Tax=Rhizopus delemar (strain RA 99-880 / ATCC MYA-4621 / FGSC 9543 / NRRL 43880) TaxID=246409 RepID=I1CV42_RHIO9|nr:hypothetical protein RO3G_17193 [Rhizopus delemar RA 99-880]|eukprot:EIE92322.1 hypothetical protein RO3G_17193 [Rhizopus delemar RA 99-880]